MVICGKSAGESGWVPWGKLRRAPNGDVIAMHPLNDHLIDVSTCFIAMSNVDGLRRAMSCAAGRALTQTDIHRLAVLVMLHDIGKCCSSFQAKYWPESAAKNGVWPTASGHGAEGWLLFAKPESVPRAQQIAQALPLAEIDLWGAASFSLLHASISHHGRPVAELNNPSRRMWDAVDGVSGGELVYDPLTAVADIGSLCRQLYPDAFNATSTELPSSAAFVHLFAGLVQLADWLGSDTRKGFFPYSHPGENRRLTAPGRAAHAVRVIGLDPALHRLAIVDKMPDFAQVFCVPTPRPMQTAMDRVGLGSIVVLEAETGSGKTEAALWRFIHLFRLGEVNSLYFALPTRVAASQLYNRVCRFVEQVWPAEAPVVIRALAGYEAADGETKIRLPEFKVLWSDNPEDTEAERRWAAESPKRFLAATIAVGTVDQALLAALPIKHAHLRHAMLSRSLLVVDEVHASDAYMTALLDRLLRAHVACGGHALLLSATLGAVARAKYLNVGSAKHPLPPPTLAEALTVPYPAISFQSNETAQVDSVDGNPAHKLVHWQSVDDIDRPEQIAARVVQAARQGARVLVIRNTVPAAVATLRAVEALQTEVGGDFLFQLNGVSTLHHSRFSKQERPLLDSEVEKQIGKHRTGSGGRIVIGTQTLEQSLDIDADLLITDLCPMDVLLQRIGRLHRHARPSPEHVDDVRPAGFESAQAWVLVPAGNDLSPLLKRMQHGLGPLRLQGKALDGIYLDLRILEVTRRLVEAQPTRSIPRENRSLVERATHPEALDAISVELGAEWQKFSLEVDGSTGAKATLGRIQALEFDKPFGERPFPDIGEQLATRLGAADRLAVFDTPFPFGPFGVPVQQMAIRHHQLPRDLPFDAQPEGIAPLDGEPGFAFSLGMARYRYSRFGLERLKQTPLGDHA